MRSLALRKVVCAAALAAALSEPCRAGDTPATGAERAAVPIDRWGALQLGMTDRQVRAVKGFVWKERQAVDPLTGWHWRSLEARDPVLLYGSPASFYLSLQNGVVVEIGLLQDLSPHLSPVQCDQAYTDLIRSVETTYGPLSPGIPAGLTVVGDTNRQATEQRKITNSSSAFSVTTSIDDRDPAIAQITLFARRSSETAALDVVTYRGRGTSDSSECQPISMKIRSAGRSPG
jgi:hypothetical protein